MSVPSLRLECYEAIYAANTVRMRTRSLASRRRRGLKGVAYAAVAVLLVVALAAASRFVAGAGGAPALRLLAGAAPDARITLVSASAERRLGFVTVTGSMLNRTGRPLRDTEVVIELLDSNSRPIRLESALPPLEPLRPGETAPFSVEARDDDAIASYRVHFRRLGGARLD